MIFTGRLDQDTNVHLVKEGDYLDAMNIRNGVGSERGVITPAEGNTLVPYDLPSNAQCIGAFENKQENSVIFFIKGDQDRICRYRDGSIETLLFGTGLFDQRIHSCKFVNNLCYFTDGKDGQGNPPRKFNITKASRNKTLTYQLDISSAVYAAGGLYTLIIKNPDGSTQSSNPLYVAAPGGDRATIVGDLITALDGYGITGVIASPTFTNIRVEDSVNRILEITSPAIFYPLNHYPLNLDLNLIKPTPFEPIPYYEQSGQENNKVYGFSFQFRYRYVFDDGEKSAWGPTSYTPTNFVVTDNERDFDRIRIDFSDARMNDSRHAVRAIELAVRTSENGIWRYVDRYDIDKTDQVYFYNDKSYPAIPSDEASDTDTQALKNYDFCPEIAMSCETVYDENGNPIMVWSGCVEGKDIEEVDCTIDHQSYIPATPVSPQSTTNKTFKSGGLYECVVVWEDDYGRQAPVYIGKYSPQFNRLGQNYNPEFSFNSLPPVWATKYRIAMTKNQNQSVYFQAPAWELQYWKIDRADDTATSTTYAAGDATHVGLSFNPTEEISGSLRNQFFDAQAPGNVFIPRTGDRVQFISWLISGGSNPGTANIADYNFDIVGYNLTTVTGTSTIDKFSIFLEFNSDFPDFSTLPNATDYIICEVYTPSNSTSPEIYYEIGPTVLITDPGTEFRTAPAVSLENYGDTVLVAQRFDNTFTAGGPYFVTPQIERNTLHKNSTDVFTDFGRVVVRNPDERQRFERNKIRATGLYTEINGLSSFKGTDYVRCSIENGTIGKLAFVDGVLLAIGEFKTQPIYVSRGRVIDASGQTLLSRSSNLFSIADELRYDLGTQNPESVVVNEGACYAFDVYRGTVWRYVAGAGQDIITKGLVNYFQAFGQYAWAQGNATIVGGFQREYNTYYISGTASSGVFTAGYDEGWVSFYSFYPEAMCSLDQRMVSFYEGALWLHESGVVGNYYGLQTKAKLKCHYTQGVEISPSEIQIVADKRWDVPLVEVPINGNYALGQISKIPDLRVFNGVWKGSFLRDERDPNFPSNERLRRGRKLWGTVIVITVETNIFSRLLSITVNAVRKSD